MSSEMQSALIGAVVGGAASLAGTWLTLKRSDRGERMRRLDDALSELYAVTARALVLVDRADRQLGGAEVAELDDLVPKVRSLLMLVSARAASLSEAVFVPSTHLWAALLDDPHDRETLGEIITMIATHLQLEARRGWARQLQGRLRLAVWRARNRRRLKATS